VAGGILDQRPDALKDELGVIFWSTRAMVEGGTLSFEAKCRALRPKGSR
jgi:hypothetical protein